MASVFRRAGSPIYLIDYTDETGRRRRVSTGLTQRRDAERVASRIEDCKNRTRLESAQVPSMAVAESLESRIKAFEQYLVGKGDVPQHIRYVMSVLRRLFRGSSIETPYDLARDIGGQKADERILAYLDGRVARAELTVRTRNFQLGVLKHLCRWANRTGRMLPTNVLGIPVRRDASIVPKCRALTDDEVNRLLTSSPLNKSSGSRYRRIGAGGRLSMMGDGD